MGILPTLVMIGIASPVICTDALAETILPTPVETELQPPAVLETALPMQLPTPESQLGASYINYQNQQVAHNNSNISVSSSGSEAQETHKSLLNERLNDKVYTTLWELFSDTNIDIVHEILPIFSIYNNEIARFVEDINIKCEMSLKYTQLEVSEIHYWVETFQISTIPNNQPEAQQSQVSSVQATEQCAEPLHHTLPSLMEQQAEIDKLTYVTQEWSTDEPCRFSEGPTH